MKTQRSTQGGDIAIVAVSIALILGLIGLGFYLILSKSSSSANDTIGANCKDLTLQKGDSNVADATTYWRIVMTNNGERACRLTGYPAAFMKDTQAHAVAGTSNSLYQPTTVVIGPHNQAHFVIGLPDPLAFPASTTCTAEDSTTLQLYLPGIESPLSTHFGESACPGFTVTALQPGA